MATPRSIRNPSDSDEDNILDGVSRALWISAYSDYIEEIGRDLADEQGLPTAGPGEDWADIDVETPDEALEAARALVAAFRDRNGEGVAELAERAGDANERQRLDDVHLYQFGWALAMMSMGTGVSWFDDNARFELTVPRIETHFDGEFFEWSLERGHMNPPRRSTLEGSLQSADPFQSVTSQPRLKDVDASMRRDAASWGVDLPRRARAQGNPPRRPRARVDQFEEIGGAISDAGRSNGRITIDGKSYVIDRAIFEQHPIEVFVTRGASARYSDRIATMDTCSLLNVQYILRKLASKYPTATHAGFDWKDSREPVVFALMPRDKR